ncbi:9-hexadecenoic acid cis-trans isomerase, partial [Vibrio parahaemolyticus]|nr:9-hexadecenoic acid cis-trans isomerase [Vibrio parahaemolyticus]
IDREQTCPTIEEYEQYEKDNPTWGMPFGMPNLSNSEYHTLMTWLENGAIMNVHQPVSENEQAQIDKYEALLNHSDLKNQLMARYIYEHL